MGFFLYSQAPKARGGHAVQSGPVVFFRTGMQCGLGRTCGHVTLLSYADVFGEP
jgi:hypothetical protein